MRTLKRKIIAGVAFSVILVVVCGKKTPEIPGIVYHNDTLSVTAAVSLDPVDAADPVHLRNVGVRILCSGGLPEKNGDSLVHQFTERLLLVSGVEWSGDASALLLNASRKLKMVTEAGDCAAVEAFADSIRKQLTKIVKSPGGAASLPVVKCTSETVVTDSFLPAFLQMILGVQPDLAGLIVEFISPVSDTGSMAAAKDMKAIISGLVSKPGEPSAATVRLPAGKPREEVMEQVMDNSAAVLKYRNQQSIRDSIEKHIPDMRQMYKKSLKAGDTFSGQVVVTIRVSAAGKVIGATIKATNINNKLFLDPFIGYVRTIRFKPVAEKLGAMTFDFPFEFNAEM